jgi:acetolactate synthase I/II/III large subunit
MYFVYIQFKFLFDKYIFFCHIYQTHYKRANDVAMKGKPAMQSSTVPTYEALAADIKDLGIECIFGLISDDTAQLITMIDSLGVRFYNARHENNAVTMAEGYAASTGRLGVVILGRGPATANGIHGATYAQRTGSSVLMICGDGPNSQAAPNSVGPDRKGFNAAAVLQDAGIRTFIAYDPVTARHTLVRAAAAAQHGAVALLLPTNVQQGQIDPLTTVPGRIEPTRHTPRPARESAIQAAASLLEKSRKPLFVVGVGAHHAGARETIIRLADHVGAALVTTVKAKDMFRDHPYDCGVLGSFSNAGGRRLIEQADCIVAIGAALNQQTTSYATSLPAGLPLIHIDKVRTNIGRWFHADVAVVGDAKLSAEQLLAAIPAREQSEMLMRSDENTHWLAKFDLADDFQAMNTPRTMDARSLALALDQLLPADRNLVWDNGNFLVALPYLSVSSPSHFKQASDFASIGMGFGTAMGFAVGTPERTTVLLLGDGSFLMTMSELETVAREYIPIVIVVMNDCAYGAEVHFLKERDMPVQLTEFPDIDYAPIAEAFGFQAATVRTVEELRALAPMLANPEGPIFLDCKINSSVAAPFLLESAEYARSKK